MNAKLLKRLRRGGTWILLCRAACMAAVLAIFAMLARALPTEGFAGYVLLSSIVVLASMAAMSGLNTLICRYLSESLGVGNAPRASEAARIVVRLGLASVLCVGLLAWWVIDFFAPSIPGVPRNESISGLVSIWIMLLAVSQIVAEFYRGLHKLRVAAVMSGVSGGLATNAILFSSLVLNPFLGPLNLQLVVMLNVVALSIPTLVAIIYLYVSWPAEVDDLVTDPGHSPLTCRSVAREAIPIMLVQVLAFGMAQLDIWVVGASCHDGDLAVYGAARRLSLLVAVPLTQVGLVVASSISELYARGDTQALQRLLRAAASLAALTSGILLVILMLFPDAMLSLLFGASFQVGSTTLRIILLGQCVYVFTGLCGPTLMMTGRQHIPLGALVATLPILAAAPLAAASYGLPAVASVFAAAIAFQNLLQWSLVRWKMGLKTHPNLSLTFLASILSSFRTNSSRRSTLFVANN